MCKFNELFLEKNQTFVENSTRLQICTKIFLNINNFFVIILFYFEFFVVKFALLNRIL